MNNIILLFATIMLFGATSPDSGYPPEQPKGTNGHGKVFLVNASHVNEYYQPVNKAIRIEL